MATNHLNELRDSSGAAEMRLLLFALRPRC
jgi:hypothetical protein